MIPRGGPNAIRAELQAYADRHNEWTFVDDPTGGCLALGEPEQRTARVSVWEDGHAHWTLTVNPDVRGAEIDLNAACLAAKSAFLEVV